MAVLVFLYCGLFWSLLASLVQGKQISKENKNIFTDPEEYLNLNLFDYFEGNNLTFTFQNDSRLDAKILNQTYQLIENKPVCPQDAKILGYRAVNKDILLLTEAIENYTLFKIQKVGNTSQLIINSTNITKTDANSKLNIFGIESISSTGQFFIDGNVTYKNGSKKDRMYYGNTSAFTDNQNLQFVDRPPPTIQPKNAQRINRFMMISMVSMLSNKMIRVSIWKPQNQALYNLTLDWLEVSDVSTAAPFKPIHFLGQSSTPLLSTTIYGGDLFIGWEGSIQRYEFQQTKQGPTGLNLLSQYGLANKMTSMTLGWNKRHLDIYYILDGKHEINRIRWDNRLQPLEMDQIDFEIGNEVIQPQKIKMANEFIIVKSSKQLSVLNIYSQKVYITKSMTPASNFKMIVSTDGVSIIWLADGNFNSLQLRSSAFLSINKFYNNGTITLKAFSENQISKPETKEVSVSIWNSDNLVQNTEDKSLETDFLGETLPSLIHLNKFIPSTWFLGQLPAFNLTCPLLPSNLLSFSLLRRLPPKKVNFDPKGLDQRNVLFVSVYAQPSKGEYLMVLQLELTIYGLLCMQGQNSQLLCRTVKKISSEKQMIIQGNIFKGRFFYYLTYQGYKIVDMLDQSAQPFIFMDSQGICEYMTFIGFDTLICSDYETKSIKTFIIKGGRPEHIITRQNSYSTQISSMEDSSFVFLSDEYSINVMGLRTTAIVATIPGSEHEILKTSDKIFQICGHYLIVWSISMNGFKQFDISDIYNIRALHEFVDLGKFNLRLVPQFKVNYQKGCTGFWPLVVTNEIDTFVLFTDISGIRKNLFKEKVRIGPYNYLANYFLNAIDVSLSAQFPRVIWSILDSSQNSTSFGFELEVYFNYKLSMDLREMTPANLTSKDISCKLSVLADQKLQTELDFKLTVKDQANKLYLGGSVNETDAKKDLDLEIFEPETNLNVTPQFVGPVIGYSLETEIDKDFNHSIVYNRDVTRDDLLSKLIKCSRPNTRIYDFYISKTASFLILTGEGIYKIKNATNYFVQNYLLLSGSDQEDSSECQRILFNEKNNLMFNLCSQGKTPFFYLSNWNGLSPGIFLRKRLDYFSDISSIREAFACDHRLFVFGAQAQSSLLFQTYSLQITPESLSLSLQKQEEVPLQALFISQFQLPLPSDKVSLNHTADIYFVIVEGDNENIKNTSMSIHCVQESDSSLKKIKSFSLSDLLGSAYSNYFSKIISLQCSFKSFNKSDEKNDGWVGCMFVQERNIHFIVELEMDGKEVKGAHLRNILTNYLNQKPTGPISFNNNYAAILTKRTKWLTSNQEEQPLTKYSILVYNISVLFNKKEASNPFSNLISPKAALPVPMPEYHDVRCSFKVLQLEGIDYLFVISDNYYPFQTYRLQDNNILHVLKNIQSEHLTLTAVNHISKASVRFRLKDRFILYLLIGLGILCGLLLLIWIIFCLCSRKKNRKTTMNVISEKARTLMDNWKADEGYSYISSKAPTNEIGLEVDGEEEPKDMDIMQSMNGLLSEPASETEPPKNVLPDSGPTPVFQSMLD